MTRLEAADGLSPKARRGLCWRIVRTAVKMRKNFRSADQRCQAIRQQVTELQGKGFYVLGVAGRELAKDASA